jgi:hypothetical protein
VDQARPAPGIAFVRQDVQEKRQPGKSRQKATSATDLDLNRRLKEREGRRSPRVDRGKYEHPRAPVKSPAPRRYLEPSRLSEPASGGDDGYLLALVVRRSV